jgi:hypothetical protein
MKTFTNLYRVGSNVIASVSRSTRISWIIATAMLFSFSILFSQTSITDIQLQFLPGAVQFQNTELATSIMET